MKNRSGLRLSAALAVAAAILLAAECVLPGNEDYINGTIGGAAYNKSGYTLAGASVDAAFLLAADSLLEYVAFNGIWQINILGTTPGTYNYPDVAIAYYVSMADLYASGDDILVEVTEYTATEIAGTFSGTFTYDGLGAYPVSGEFRLRF